MGAASAAALQGLLLVAALLASIAPCVSASRDLQELELPPNLVSLTSREGQERLLTSKYKGDYFLLAEHYVSQINGAFCGPASASMVLNALGVPRPLQAPDSRLNSTKYAYFTQENVFNEETELVAPKAQVLQQGMSLNELTGFLSAHEGVAAQALHSGDENGGQAGFRAALMAALAQPDSFAIVNFDRAVLKEYGGGHHSPVAAYHQDSDSFLVLDVSRYKYTAWWVGAKQLYASTSASVDSSTNNTRGAVVIWSTARYGSQVLISRSSIASSRDGGGLALPQGMDNGLPALGCVAGASWGGAASAAASRGQRVEGRQGGVSSAALASLLVLMTLVGAALGAVAMMLKEQRKQVQLLRLDSNREQVVLLSHGSSGSGTATP